MSEIEKMKRYIERTKMSKPKAAHYGMNLREALELAKQAYHCGDLPPSEAASRPNLFI